MTHAPNLGASMVLCMTNSGTCPNLGIDCSTLFRIKQLHAYVGLWDIRNNKNEGVFRHLMTRSVGQKSIKCRTTWYPKPSMVSRRHDGITSTKNKEPNGRKGKTVLTRKTSAKILSFTLFIYFALLRTFTSPPTDSHIGE